MPAKWVVTLAIVAGLGSAAYATIGPDSIYQNVWVDPRNAQKTMGRLEKLYANQPDKPPQGKYRYVIFLPGIQPTPSQGEGSDEAVAEIRTAWSRQYEGMPTIYQDAMKAKFTDHYCVLVFTFDPAKSREDRARDLHYLIEAHPELTKASAEFDVWAWSEGGNIMHCYSLLYGERKVRQVRTLNTPHYGAYFPDELLLEKAFKVEYGSFAGGQAFKAVQKNSPFDAKSPGIQGLRYGCPELLELHNKWPLTKKWHLYASSIPPNPSGVKGILTTAMLGAEAFVFKSNPSNLPTRGNYRESAKIIRRCETLSGKKPSRNDGMVSYDSMTASWPGIKHEATVYEAGDYTHSEIVVGQEDYTFLRRLMIDSGWIVVAAKTNLPTLPSVIRLPTTARTTLRDARVVTVRSGRVYVGGALNTNPTSINFGVGTCVWAEWSGDSVVLSTNRAIYLADASTGQVMKIATGTLGLVDEDTGRVCFYCNKVLCILEKVGAPVQELDLSVNTLAGPPQLLGDRIYCLDGTKLYSVPVGGGSSKLEVVGVAHVRQVTEYLLVEKKTDQGTTTDLFGALPFSGRALRLNLGYTRKYHVQADQIDVDSTSFQVYLTIQGSLYYLDKEAERQYRQAGVPYSFTEVFKPCGRADSMDIK